MASTRKRMPPGIKEAVLTEAGYRCAVPTCHSILALDVHHIVEVNKGGGNTVSNLVALCPTCHALYHRGTIPQVAIRRWKTRLIAINSGRGVKSAITELRDLEESEVASVERWRETLLHDRRIFTDFDSTLDEQRLADFLMVLRSDHAYRRGERQAMAELNRRLGLTGEAFIDAKMRKSASQLKAGFDELLTFLGEHFYWYPVRDDGDLTQYCLYPEWNADRSVSFDAANQLAYRERAKELYSICKRVQRIYSRYRAVVKERLIV